MFLSFDYFGFVDDYVADFQVSENTPPMSFLPIRRVKVSGGSMLPRFKDGQILLFQGAPKPGSDFAKLTGKVVLVMRDSYPGIFFIKRVKSVTQDGIWVEGDNLEESTDSRNWGYVQPHEIVAVAFRK
jgi:phage repressor protein C with HTH and peptisase S24 domain